MTEAHATGDWTLGELTERVAGALASDAVRAPNGRVRDLPDARAIRWYATIGLVDRPLPAPGRAARYGARHLLQLVAVKRRQAQGRTLAQIQAELTGATDEQLRAIARVPDEVLRLPATAAPQAQPRPRFWVAGTAPTRPAPAPAPEPELGLIPLRRKASAPTPVEPGPVAVRYQIGLPGGATLGLGALPGPDDLAAIHAAAAPLLALLAARGLLTDDDLPDEGFRPHEGEAR